MGKYWYSYKTKNGVTLFYYNSESGEHRWASGFEPPQCAKAQPDEIPLIQMCTNIHKMPKRKKKSFQSTGTETEEYCLVNNHQTTTVRDIGTNTESTNALCLLNCNHDGDDFQTEFFSQRPSASPPQNPFATDRSLFKTQEEMVEREFNESNKGSLVDNLFAMELSSVLSSDDKSNADSCEMYRQTSVEKESSSLLVPLVDAHTSDGMQEVTDSRDPKASMNEKDDEGKAVQECSIENRNTLAKGCYLGLSVGKEGQIYVNSEPLDEGNKSEIKDPGSEMTGEIRVKLERSHDDDDEESDATKFSISEFLPNHPTNDNNSASSSNSSRLQCDTCKRAFKKLSHLHRHMTTHTNRKPHACTICNKRFREANCLKKHLRIHTGEKPYHCSVCDKAFSQSQNLNKHMNIHTGNKPHKCKECGKAFSQHSHLARHKLIHTGEKPYCCNKCGKAYRTSSHLVRHFKSSNH